VFYMDSIIENHELADWINDYPRCEDYLLCGYREAISDMTGCLFTDPRSLKNNHIVNNNFENNPAYFIGFNAQPEQRLFVLSCLYVFPEYRHKGFGNHLINVSQSLVRDQGAIQVAVEEEKLELLKPFYEQYGFQTTGTVRTNLLGKGYVDFFWSDKAIRLSDSPNGTLIEPVT